MFIQPFEDPDVGDVIMLRTKSTFEKPNDHYCHRPAIVIGVGKNHSVVQVAIGDCDQSLLNHPNGFTILPLIKMEEAGIQSPTTFNLCSPVTLNTRLKAPIHYTNTIVQIGRLSKADINRMLMKIALINQRGLDPRMMGSSHNNINHLWLPESV